jgi:glycosyltransferase involved in cell wall biosynthesis
VVPAVGRARAELPELRGEIYGNGPERDAVLAAIAHAGLDDAVTAPGFVDADEIDAALRRALCMVLPSEREGYGLIVVEASARGTPSVVVRAQDNAAVELVDDGENGVIAESAAPEHLAAAILRVHREGLGLRERTCAWFVRNAERLSLGSSLERVVREYGS